MKIILYLCLLLFTVPALSQDWSKLHPFTHCNEFYFEYKSVEHNGELRYKVRLPEDNRYREFREFDQVLVDLNNLEVLTDELSESSKLFCPAIELKNIDLISCLKTQKDSNPLSNSYINFSKNVMSLFSTEGMTCNDVNQLEFIGKELEKEKVTDLEFKPKDKNLFRGIIKLFVTDDSDKLINMYGECGGKKFSRNFIRNSIILMAREQCIFPKPEGYLDFADVVDMANDVSADYDNMGMLKLYSKSSQILDESLLGFTELVMKDQVANLLEIDKNDPKINNILAKSKNWEFLQQKMKHTHKKIKYDGKKYGRGEHIQDYITNVFGTNVTYELAELIIPDIIETNIKSQLPTSWDEEKKNNFIEETIIPSVNKNYASCIKPVKEHIGLSNYTMTDDFSKSSLQTQNINDQKFIETRKSQFKEYCDQYPSKCNNENQCLNKSSLFTQGEDVSSMNKIQSCLFESFYNAIPEILNPVVDDAYEEANKIEPLPEGKNQEVKEKAQKELDNCFSLKVEQLTGKKGFKDGRFNTEAALYLSSGQFSNTLTSCLDIVEDNVATNIMREVVSVNQSLKQSFEDLGDFDQAEYDNVVSNLVDQTYKECIDRQRLILDQDNDQYKLKIKDPLICSALIEIKASSLAIENILKVELKEQGLKENEITKIVSENKTCSANAYENAKKNIGAINSPTPIIDSKTAGEYLDENQEFLNCTIESISDISYLVSEDMYADLVKSEDVIQDKNYALSLTPIVTELTQKCITNGTKLLGSWSSFTKQISKPETLSDLSDKCKKIVEDEITSKIVINETTNELFKIVNDSDLLIQNRSQNRFDIGNVLALSAVELRKKYDLELPQGIMPDDIIEWSVKHAYIKSVQESRNPDAFMDEYKEIVEYNTVKVIRKNLLAKLKTKSTGLNSSNFDLLADAVTPSCTHKLYNNLKEELSPEGTSNVSIDETVELVLDYLGEGLLFLQNSLGQAEYEKKMKEVKKICKNASQYKNLLDLQKTTAFDWVVKKVLFDEIGPKFDQLIYDDYISTVKGIANDPMNMFSQKTLHRKIEAANAKYINLQALHKKWFEDGSMFNKMLFDDDEITSFALLNIQNMLKEDSPERKALEEKITNKIFDNTQRNSFADEFIKEQLLSGLIVSGTESVVDAAGEKARNKTWVYRNTTEESARYHTREFWSPKKVKEIFDWEGMGDSQRKKLLKSVVENVVKPQSKNQEADNDAVNDLLTDHIEEYEYSDGKTMSDHIADYVTPKAEADVTVAVGTDILTVISPIIMVPARLIGGF